MTWTSSTNGITEYRADAFGGALRGDLLLVSLNAQVTRVKLDGSGASTVLVDRSFANAGAGALDITTTGSGEPFAGSIWIANRVADSITVLRPASGTACGGAYVTTLDEDGDGYSDADEIDNGTDPCSSASFPSDFDGDRVSDLNDPDDDGDGWPDVSDPFALDPQNGMTPGTLPLRFLWENNQGALGGLLGIGFTGLMTDGVTDIGRTFYTQAFATDLSVTVGLPLRATNGLEWTVGN